MKRAFVLAILTLMISAIMAQNRYIRKQKDTIGFASKAWQMDSLIMRLNKTYAKYYNNIYKTQNISKDDVLRFAICPHDDYTYDGFLYNELYPQIKAKTVIILGVAHKAKKFKVEQKIVFDSYKYWHAPYNNIKISLLREQIMKNLPQNDYIVHDSLQQEEHSVEAFIPFLQYYDKNVEIVSILIPHMPYETMKRISLNLAKSIQKVFNDNHLQWGKDIAIIVSTDAVHYGDQDWDGKNYAPYSCDSNGYRSAVSLEHLIMKECFVNPDPTSSEKFYNYTVQNKDWHEYKWTWCGRYSVPFGLLTAYNLNSMMREKPLELIISDYSTSIAQKPLKVDDLKMGATAPASLHHWVGYPIAGYK